MEHVRASAPAAAAADTPRHAGTVLRLRAGAEALARLLRMPPLAFMAADAPARSVAYVVIDTPRGLLRKAGLTLQVHRDGERHVQTLEVAGEGALKAAFHGRQMPVEGFVPHPDVLKALGKELGRRKVKKLAPLFRVSAERTNLSLPARAGSDGGSIAVTIEQGTLEASDRTEPLAEISLSLVEGQPGDLYQLALALHGLEPLTLETRSPVARGYTLAGAVLPPWRKAESVPMHGAMTLDAGIAAVLGQCVDHWLVNQAAARDGRDIEGVHQMRVGLRRLRAALAFFGPWLSGGAVAGIEGDVKWMARRLGKVRDLDVLLADTLAPVCRERGGDGGLKRLVRVVEQRQAEAHAKLVAAMDAPRYTTLALTVGRWLAEHGWRDGAGDTLDGPMTQAVLGALDACHDTVLQAGRDFADLDQEARHNLRLGVKRLRYAVQFVGGAFGGDLSRWLRVLSDLQDGLGAANDAALAEMLLADATRGKRPGRERRELATASGLVVGWWMAQAGGRETGLRETWSAFLALPPFWREERSRLQVVEGGGAAH